MQQCPAMWPRNSQNKLSFKLFIFIYSLALLILHLVILSHCSFLGKGIFKYFFASHIMVLFVYQGNSNPMSSSSILGSNRAYDLRNHGDSGSSGQAHMLSTTIPALPERPDQPECRHFMSSGTCKYGSDCKYHHPKERIAQLATNTMGPFGLPLRPVSSLYTSHLVAWSQHLT